MALNTAIRGLQIADAVAGVGLKKDASGNFEVDLNELSAIAVDVSADSIAIVDATDSSTKKEAIADVITAIAGSGLTATAGVLSVDAVAGGIVEGDFVAENESANCNGVTTDFTLDNTPVTASVAVYLNGLFQEVGSGKDYTLAGTTVTFAVAPLTGDILIILYVINN